MSRRPRVERLLPFACGAGAFVLIASDFMDTFRFDAIDETTGATAAVATIADRHQGAMLILGLFAIVALVIAIAYGSKPAAAAVAIAGVTAVLLFVLIDVPDSGKVGTFSSAGQSFVEAKAVPLGGFWLELIGALVLAVCGGALATLSPAQLRALRPGSGKADEKRPRGGGASSASKKRREGIGKAPEKAGGA